MASKTCSSATTSKATQGASAACASGTDTCVCSSGGYAR
jgi:hypothetical protein